MTKNENGVYIDYQTEIVARRGRSQAEVHIAQCDDGQFRFSVAVSYSYGGFAGPITDDGPGFPSYAAARDAALARLIERFPKAWESEPQSVHVELADLRGQVEQHIVQPSLF